MNRIKRQAHVAFVAFLAWLPNPQAAAAESFSDDNWNGLGNFRNPGALPRTVGGVGAVATDVSGNLYVGGEFTTAGGVFATNVAKWNGSNWSALGSGINGGIGVLLAVGHELYVGGQFTMAGGVPATNIAKWNGSNWSALGGGVSAQPLHAGYVSALVSTGGDLYAAGYFTNAGGIPAHYVARWNGSSWSALGAGVGFVVQALAASANELYAGGHFTTGGGSPANYVAKWNGQSWSPLGSGMDEPVYSLALLGNDLYAGGYFKTAGGVAATNIARWDGANWSALGLGIRALDAIPYHQGSVNALTVSGNELYAAGNFAWGEDWAWNYRIAKWNGNSWSAIGSGMNDFVPALAVAGATLYAGTSGDQGGYIAKARIGSTVRSIATTNSTTLLQFSGVTGYAYDVQRSTSLQPSSWTTVTSSPLIPAPDGSFAFTDTNTTSGKAFYRLHKP